MFFFNFFWPTSSLQDKMHDWYLHQLGQVIYKSVRTEPKTKSQVDMNQENSQCKAENHTKRVKTQNENVYFGIK